MRLSAEQIARLTAGQLLESVPGSNPVAQGITWDSREVAPGNLYVALKGQRVNGHDFVAAAFGSGAKVALVCE